MKKEGELFEAITALKDRQLLVFIALTLAGENISKGLNRDIVLELLNVLKKV